jgi:O-methyltransferase
MSQLSRPDAMRRAFEFAVKSEVQGDYYEFGVFEGSSLKSALHAQRIYIDKLDKKACERFYAFDSFSGLPVLKPEDELASYAVFAEGQYACTVDDVRKNLRDAGFDPDAITYVPGFYEDSLSKPETLEVVAGSKAGVIHVDCDLQSSAADCLAFLSGRILDGAVLLFDDWFCYRGRPDCGVRAAFDEWLKSSSYHSTEYFNYSWAGKAHIIHEA